MTKKQLEAAEKVDKTYTDVFKDEGFKMFFAKELTRQMLFNPKLKIQNDCFFDKQNI